MSILRDVVICAAVFWTFMGLFTVLTSNRSLFKRPVRLMRYLLTFVYWGALATASWFSWLTARLTGLAASAIGGVLIWVGSLTHAIFNRSYEHLGNAVDAIRQDAEFQDTNNA